MLISILPTLLAVPAFSADVSKVYDVCPRVRFIGKNPKLTQTEKKLVCGDPGMDGWKNIPLSQAQYFITSFLQQRGRYFPLFKTEDERLMVDIGTTTIVSKVTGTGLDGIYDLGKRRKIAGELLTPELLDKTKTAIIFELQSRGYPCPRIVVTSDARTGEVRVDVDANAHYLIPPIFPPNLEGLSPGIFNRYQAFHPGDPFDIRMLSLTSDRMKQDALFLSAYYDVACSSEGLHITQRVVEAKPHMVTLGIGADTEGLVTGKMRWQESRIGENAGSAQVNLLANEQVQSLDSNLKYYMEPDSRFFIMPDAFIRREDEAPYQALHSEFSVSPGWTHDGDGYYFETRAGPAVDYFNTIVGLGPIHDTWFALDSHTTIRTHLYEFYERNPQQGWSATLDTSSRLVGADSAIASHKLVASGESLWDLGNFAPPSAILATRGFIGTTWVPTTANVFSELPPTDRFFLGGDANVRGIPLEALPGDGTGFLTAVYDGIELRMGDVLPAGLQPFTFIDAAMGAERPFHLDPDVYYSPGIGLRWATPFGSIRTTLGRGLVWRNGSPTAPPTPKWQFFFSFGKEF